MQSQFFLRLINTTEDTGVGAPGLRRLALEVAPHSNGGQLHSSPGPGRDCGVTGHRDVARRPHTSWCLGDLGPGEKHVPLRAFPEEGHKQ
jgi:hypothetical protein